MSAQIITDVSQAATALRSGELVAFATETVYGLGANALDVSAVARVFEAKQRPHFDPLIVHLSRAEDVHQVVSHIPPAAQRLMDACWPGPLTLVLPKQPCVPDLVTSGLCSVAVRVPAHEMARDLIQQAGVPVAAPSANPFGRISPTTAQHVKDHLGESIDWILDGGACSIGVESTVLQVSENNSAVLLRAGGLTVEQIEEIIGPIQRTLPVTPSEIATPAPGMLEKHYAPLQPVRIVDHWSEVTPDPSAGVMTFYKSVPADQFGHVEVLSPTRNLHEAATHFFAALRRLEASAVTTIFAERLPEEGLGRALNDRLWRASRSGK